MNIHIYKTAFNRLLRMLNPLCQAYNKNKFWFLWDALKCHIRYGVTPNEYIGFEFYKKSHLEKSQYYTARHSDKYEPKFNDYKKADIFNRKEETLKKFAAFVHRNWVYTSQSTPAEIEEFIKSVKKSIVKPNNLSSGRGIHVLKQEEKIEDLIANECLLEEFVDQHPILSTINSSSVNTIRIYSVKTSKNIDISTIDAWCKENTIIYSASIRVGGENAEVDNFHAGGVGYPIDIRNGYIKGEGKNILGVRFSHHPTSGIKMVGFQIPRWNEILEYVFQMNQVIPEARLIAWDIAITQDGLDLIEANYLGDPGVMQAPSNTGFLKLLKSAL